MRRRALLRTAPVAALGVAGCLNTDAGPGTPAGTDEPPGTDESPGTPTDDPTPATAWTRSLDGGVTHAPAVAADSVYAGTESGKLYALGVDDGRERWTAPLEDPLASRPKHVDGTVYLVAGTHEFSANQRLLAFDAASGEQRWSFSPTGWWLTLHAVDGGTAYVSTRDDAIGDRGETLYALDRADGSKRWRAEVGDSYGSAFTEGTVAVATSGRLYALDRADGSERWTVDAEDVERPRAGSGTVFARIGRGTDAHVRAYDARSGEELWRFSEWPVASLTLNGGLYAGGSRLARLARDTGEPAWRADSPGFVPGVPVSDGRIYAGGDGVVAHDTADGERTWSFSPQRGTVTHTGGPGSEPTPEILVPEVVVGDAVLVRGGGNDASPRRAYALVAGTGEQRWSWEADGELTALTGTDERAYAGSASGTLYAFDPATDA